MRQIKPMGAVSVKEDKLRECYESDNYIGEKKYDGSRYIAQKCEGKVYLTSRTESVKGGQVDKTANVPQIIEEILTLPDGTVLDGEIDVPGNVRCFKFVQGVMGSLPDRANTLQTGNQIRSLFLCIAVIILLGIKGKKLD